MHVHACTSASLRTAAHLRVKGVVMAVVVLHIVVPQDIPTLAVLAQTGHRMSAESGTDDLLSYL